MRRLAAGLALFAGGVAVGTAQADKPAGTVVHEADAVTKASPPGTATITVLAQGTEAFVGKLAMDPGAAVPTHRDATEEYIVVLEGAGTLTLDGVAHPVRAGTAVYMPADAEVSFQNGDAPMVALQVFAGPEPAKKYDAWKPAD